MGSAAVVRAFAEINAALAVLAAEVAEAGSGPFSAADPLRGLADGCLDILSGVAASEARLAGLKAQAVAVYAQSAQSVAHAVAPTGMQGRAQEMALVAEVAGVLTISDRASGALLNQSRVLTSMLPLTMAGLQGGFLSWVHARVMAEEAATLEPAVAAALEAHFLDPKAPNPARGAAPGELVPHRFRHKARTWRERHHPESLEKRHAKGAADRRVEHRPDLDGMAWFNAYLPADTASAIWNRTTALARGIQGPGESRSLSQLRADVFAAEVLRKGQSPASAAADVRIPQAQVLVTVPVLALLDLTDEPAMLDGHGPIPASMARKLVADGAGSFYRVLVDPRDGAPLEIGRTSYRVTKAMRRWLRLRDGKCPFPGCSNHSLDNEADHILAWRHGGSTGISNLGQLCPKHHRLKHTSTWTPTAATKNEPPGWISPSGRRYKSEHPDWEPPRWPMHLRPTPNPDAVRGYPDFVHSGLSPGEVALKPFLHRRA